MKYHNKNIIILIKISIIEKAINMGWSVKMINNKLILRKKLNNVNELEKNTDKFLDYLLNPL